MVRLPGLDRLGGGVDVKVVVLTCCIVRLMPGKAFVVGGCILGLLSECSGFGGPLDCIGVFSLVEGMRVVEACKLASDCLPIRHFCMVD